MVSYVMVYLYSSFVFHTNMSLWLQHSLIIKFYLLMATNKLNSKSHAVHHYRIVVGVAYEREGPRARVISRLSRRYRILNKGSR